MDELDDLLDNSTQTTSGIQRPLPYSAGVLVLGILSILGCFLYGVVGLICGIIALVLHQKNKKIYLQDTLAFEGAFRNSKAGFICAIIGTSLSGLYVLILVLVVTLGLSLMR